MIRSLHYFRRLLSLLALAAPLVSSGAEDFKTSTTHFESGGKRIKVAVYSPKAGAPAAGHTPVIVLHGSGGMLFDGPEMKRVAAHLAQAGHDVYVVHYFNRTGHLFATGGQLDRNFSAWNETVRDAVTWVADTRKDGRKIGIFGYSLGGFLAVSEAMHHPRIGAVVSLAGGIWKGQQNGVTKVAPLLIIHGRKDERVPFNKYVPPMLALWKQHGTSCETAYYDKEAHRFTEPALVKVRQQTAAFFARRLGGAGKR